MGNSSTRTIKTPNSSRRDKVEKCVLCATDLSQASQQALATAAEMAEAFDAKLLVVHGMEIWDKRYDFLVADLQQKLAVQAREKVAQELEHLGKTEAVPIEVLIKHGPVIEQVIKVVVERDPLMLVIGSNSGSDARKTHLGGMAQELIRLSPVSVIITRPSPAPNIKHILCAVGGSSDSKITLNWAFDLARRERVSEITILHTYEVPTGYLEAGMTYESVDQKMRKLHENDLKGLLDGYKDQPVKVNVMIESGPVAETVATVADREKADLLVVGSETRSFLAALLLGRMGLSIASKTHIPVALVKSKKHKLGLLAALERL